MLTKAELREHLLAQRTMLTPADIEQRSSVIAAYVCALPAFCVSHTVMVYLALPQEVQTMQIITQARQSQKRVAVPVIRGQDLVAVALSEASTQLRRGRFGILEPCGPQHVIHPQEIGCITVPGIAFDARGGRLGFGKGYYDRFLRQLPVTTYRCGLAFGIQVVPCVPQAPHDICMHGIVTEQGYIPCMHALP
jgi:5-formyltetrahydrofolate cyclo-ligase